MGGSCSHIGIGVVQVAPEETQVDFRPNLYSQFLFPSILYCVRRIREAFCSRVTLVLGWCWYTQSWGQQLGKEVGSFLTTKEYGALFQRVHGDAVGGPKLGPTLYHFPFYMVSKTYSNGSFLWGRWTGSAWSISSLEIYGSKASIPERNWRKREDWDVSIPTVIHRKLRIGWVVCCFRASFGEVECWWGEDTGQRIPG